MKATNNVRFFAFGRLENNLVLGAHAMEKPYEVPPSPTHPAPL